MKHLKYRSIKIEKQLLLLLLCLVFFSFNTKAQDDDDSPIKVDTTLLTMPVTVSDGKGRYISGLLKDNFSIFQNGDEQEIEYFFNEEAPINVAVLIDTSASTEKVLDNLQKAARDFIKVLRPEDKGLIVSFDYRTKFLSDLTADKKKLVRAVEDASITDKEGSDMNDAVYQIVNKYFSGFRGRKAIIVLTDGMVVKRNVSSQQIMDGLRKTDTFFYPVIFRTKFYNEAMQRAAAIKQKPMTIELLEILAMETAGKFYEKDAANLREAFQSIAEELKNQYLLGFYPQQNDSGKIDDDIRIEVDRKDLKVKQKKRWSF